MNNHLIITIPQYIRKVKMSEKQLPIYYEYKNGIIKAKNKDLPDKYLTKEAIDYKILNEGRFICITAGLFKEHYGLCTFRNNKLHEIVFELNFDTLTLIDRNAKQRFVKLRDFTEKLFVTNLSTKERLVANPLKVGTPRMIVINAQSIFSGNLREHEKEAVMLRIKKSFVPFIQNLKPIDFYPVRIRMYLYDTVKNEFDRSLAVDNAGTRWDLINRSYMYMKSFADLLVEGLKDKSISTTKVLQDDDRLHLTEDGGCVFCPIEKSENRRLVFVVAKDDENFAKIIEPLEKDRQWLIKNNPHYKEIMKKYGN